MAGLRTLIYPLVHWWAFGLLCTEWPQGSWTRLCVDTCSPLSQVCARNGSDWVFTLCRSTRLVPTGVPHWHPACRGEALLLDLRAHLCLSAVHLLGGCRGNRIHLLSPEPPCETKSKTIKLKEINKKF